MVLLLLILACGGVPILENPISTLINAHARFRYVVSLLKSRGISLLAKLILNLFDVCPKRSHEPLVFF